MPKDRIGDALSEAQNKLLRDRDKVFQEAQELGQKVTEQRQAVDGEQRKLAELTQQYSILQNDLRKIEAQIVFCDEIMGKQ